ncbi:AraC family transcriptional regulator [Fontibacillus phaseoli]|uniref:AraC family transcriptional regulator n=1 Tax=Fontibacillus phaseoli TaxID=1416533 RepID=A0A369BM21_9BACL|nr:AraC family transcriptional regulator [Fontibacillus phaseoli]RCX22652.1 AraC family transcriptional regulator [Fontibacillus phaseoli]
MLTPAYRRYVFSPSGNPHLPLLVESIGYNPSQEKVTRPEGYPCYHWIQTEAGEGRLTYGNETVVLEPHTGLLLPPGMPHTYETSDGKVWRTLYLTFGGEATSHILSAFAISEPAFFHWEPDSPLAPLLGSMLEQLDTGDDLFGLETSTQTYRFLGLLSKFGQASSISVTRNMEKLNPLLKWMEKHYGNPDLGLDSLADVLGISGRHLSKLFQLTFGLSPYAYLVQMRIHKAKERLAGDPDLTVASIAGLTGFRDTSHFVATFRKHTGLTPQQFRKLH